MNAKKKKQIVAVICISVVVIFAFGGLYFSLKSKDKASRLQYFFHQTQWKNIDFTKNKYDMFIAPSFDDSVKDDIIAASKDAGIKNPILPHDADQIPEGTEYYFAVVQEDIDPETAYELRFFVLANQSNPEQVYSIWISAVPLVHLEKDVFENENKEFIFSVNDSPESVRRAMIKYFEHNRK